ncbi:MAG TPA: dihydropteroate synthase [Victivallales bacterium]|nr:dihydropteroate synthase [Victivallales bacterium]
MIGILNVTPDSFSDGGKFFSHDKAFKHAIKMLNEGADIIDIGGESSRPGSKPIDATTELNRIIPIVKMLRKEYPDAIISIDTTKYLVAKAALEAGADIINNINGLRNSQNIAPLCAEFNAGLILMHMRGTPATMREHCFYDNLIDDIKNELAFSIKIATDSGVNMQNIILDPGIGFAKNTSQNLEIIKNWTKLKELKRPILIGHSKKSFIGDSTEVKLPEDRLPATCALSFYLAMQGVDFLRVHDVKENLQAVKMAKILGEKCLS